MPVNTGISTSLRRPQTFHQFAYLQGGRSLVPLPQRLLNIGTMKGGTAVAGTIYQISDAPEADALFGVGQELALMCRKDFETGAMIGQGPVIYAAGVAEQRHLAVARGHLDTLVGEEGDFRDLDPELRG